MNVKCGAAWTDPISLLAVVPSHSQRVLLFLKVHWGVRTAWMCWIFSLWMLPDAASEQHYSLKLITPALDTSLCCSQWKRVSSITSSWNYLLTEYLVKTLFVFDSRQKFSFPGAFPVCHAVCPAVSPERSSVQHQCGWSIKPAYVEKVFNLHLFKTAWSYYCKQCLRLD